MATTRKAPARKAAKRPSAKKPAAKKKAASRKVPATRASTKPAAKKPAARGRGRPTKYRAEFCEQAGKLAQRGWTEVEIADFLEVDVSTLWRWKGEHSEFCSALKLHKGAADDRVEASLYQRALGYEVDEVDIRVVNGEIVKTPVRKHYPPDPTSMIFWLKNRKRADWRNQPDPADGSDEAPPPVEVTVQVVDGRKPGRDAEPEQAAG